MRRRQKGHKRRNEEEVYHFNKNNPADRPGQPTVWDPEDTLTNKTGRGMKPPRTKYKNRGEFFSHQHDRGDT